MKALALGLIAVTGTVLILARGQSTAVRQGTAWLVFTNSAAAYVLGAARGKPTVSEAMAMAAVKQYEPGVFGTGVSIRLDPARAAIECDH